MTTAPQILKSPTFAQVANELAGMGRFMAQQGWSPATSSNYSTLIDEDHIAISRTGVDKFNMSPEDIIIVSRSGQVLAPPASRSSAETLIHTAIYNCLPSAKAVLHTHSPENTRLSLRFQSHGQIEFENYELQKGLEGISTHEQKIILPILPNSQDMEAFSATVEDLLREHQHIHGFLMAGHGLYTWGSSLAAAKRHVETFEFLLRCRALELAGV